MYIYIYMYICINFKPPSLLDHLLRRDCSEADLGHCAIVVACRTM